MGTVESLYLSCSSAYEDPPLMTTLANVEKKVTSQYMEAYLGSLDGEGKENGDGVRTWAPSSSTSSSSSPSSTSSSPHPPPSNGYVEDFTVNSTSTSSSSSFSSPSSVSREMPNFRDWNDEFQV